MSQFKRHQVDGFQLTFTGRQTWKAHLQGGGIDEIVPVTWTRDISEQEGERYVIIYYRDFQEMTARRQDPRPFLAAIATARNWQARPLKFQNFDRVLRCESAFARLGEHSFQAKVLQRLFALKTGEVITAASCSLS